MTSRHRARPRLPLPALAMLALLCSTALAQPASAQPAPRQEQRAADDESSPVETMNKARRYFDYGDYPSTSRILNRLDISSIESPELRIDAYRLLGLSLFYQGKRGEAYRAFLELLYLEPDFQMDPFYVPPAAAEAFNEVRRDADAQLEPIRKQRREEDERRRLALEKETARRRQREREEELRRMAQLAPVVERRVVQREFWVTMLPFGVGQLQNGDRSLGIGLATSEVIAGAASAGSALLIEGLRDSSGKFSEGSYPLAQRLNASKWIGAGIFYALWAFGAVHAAVHFQPESAPVDRLVTSGSGGPLPTPTAPGLPPLLPAPVPDPTPAPGPERPFAPFP